MRFKSYQNTALFGVVGAEAVICSDLYIGIRMVSEDFSGKCLCRILIVGMTDENLSARIAVLLHTVP